MMFEKAKNSKNLQKFREWIGKTFSKISVSPNQWTLISLMFAILAAIAIYNMNFLLGAGLVIISGLIDLIDGAVARQNKKVTKKGAYLDTIIDRYNEMFYVLPLLFIPMTTILFPFYIWVFLFLFGGMMTTYAKAAAKEKGLENELRGGIIERAERVGVYVISLIIANFNLLFFQYIFILLALLSNVSALQRIFKAISDM